MSIADTTTAIKTLLDSWATKEGGTAFVASDPSHMWEMAYAASDKPRVIICFVGEDVRGPFSFAAGTHRVDQKFNVVVTRGRGFNAARGESLTVTRGNARPLFSLFEEARDMLRSMIGISMELPVDYINSRNFQMGELIMDAYVIEFSIAVDLPMLGGTPDNYVSPTPEV